MAEQASDVLIQLRDLIREFVNERDWDQFHTPKNLAVSLCVEAAELLEPFQWLPTGALSELSGPKQEHVRHEIADVFVYLIRLADKLNIDLTTAVRDKLELNRAKYPAQAVRGSALKYNEHS
jgi:NTP pyrophosphatase (non-canonical NTP hydrolase)